MRTITLAIICLLIALASAAQVPAVSPEAPSIISEPKTVTLGERDHQAVQLTLAAPQSE